MGSPSSSSDQPWTLVPANMPFVGREALLQAAEDAFDRAVEGYGQIVLLSGEPGIGKTRMAEEVAAIARSHGALVAWGSCHEWEGAPAYWPWTQVLRVCLQSQPPDLRLLLTPLQRILLSHFVPELRDQETSTDPAGPSVPEAQLYQILIAISAIVHATASNQPLVIVLDDVHWADIPSLQVLRFLAIDARSARVLVIATYRAADLTSSHPATGILTDLSREPHSIRLPLRGLTEEQVGRFMALVAAEPQPETLVHGIFEETDGNPFFVTEVVRMLAEERSLGQTETEGIRLKVPESVRGAIQRRVQHLTAECRRMLAIASVAGRDLDANLIEGAAGMSPLQLLDLLDEATRAQIIVPTDGPARFRFSHALVQQTLYEGLAASERVKLHLSVAEALESQPGREPQWEALAYHYVQAGRIGDPAKTLTYAEHAGQVAMSLFAWELAAAHYSHALDALALIDRDDTTRRCTLLLALGEARNRSGPGSGDAPAARECFLEAFRLADVNGDSLSMAQAAVGFAGLNIVTAFGEQQQELLERALAALPIEPSPLRVRVLGRLAVDLWNRSTENLTRSRDLADEAVAAAAHLNDATLHGFALWARHFSPWRPDSLNQRRAIAERLVAFADQTNDPVMTAWGYISLMLDCVEAGDLTAAERSLAVVHQLNEHIQIPYVALREVAYSGMLALLAGDYSNAEPLIKRASDLWQSAEARQHQLQSFVLLRDIGRLDQFTDDVDLPSSWILWGVATAAHRMWLALARNDVSTARRAYDDLVADDFTRIPFDAYWYGVMIPLAEAAIAFHDEPRARRIFDLLAPYDRRLASVGILGVAHGPVALTLGQLALELDELDVGKTHLTNALAMSERLGMRPYIARALVALAETALRSGSTKERMDALGLARQAADVADSIGMAGLVPRNPELAAAFKAQRATRFGLTARELDVLRLVAEGLTDQEVAERLFVSPRTVGAHLTSIYSRLNVSSRTAAARIALEHQLF